MFTLEKLLNEWLETYIKPCKSKNTYECYRYTIILIFSSAPQLRDKKLDEVSEMEIQKLINTLSSLYSKSTLRKIRIVLHQAYNVAVRNDLCHKNPIQSITIPTKASEKEIRGLTRSEQEKVELAAQKDPLGHLVLFLLDTGLRISELFSLKWDDYDSSKDVIYIRESKTAAGIRTIPLLPRAKKIIERQPHVCEYIFTNTVNEPLTKYSLRRLIQRIRNDTGLDWITAHVFRHTFATRLLESHVEYKALSTLLGHTNIAFTLHCYPSTELLYLKEQMSLMDKTKVS